MNILSTVFFMSLGNLAVQLFIMKKKKDAFIHSVLFFIILLIFFSIGTACGIKM